MKKDWILYGVFLFLIGFLIWLLYFISNQKIVSPLKPVGHIVYRHKIAERRSSSSFLWEYLNQADLVYNKDSIRTDDRAEALIELDSGTKIDLDPMTMIVLKIEDQEEELEIKRGSLSIARNGWDKSLSIKTDSEKIILRKGDLKIQKRENSLVLRAVEEVSFTFRDRDYRLVQKDTLKLENGKVQLIEEEFIDRKPENAKKLFLKEKESVLFSWKVSNENSFLIIFRKGENKPVFSEKVRGTNFHLLLPEGSYEWKLKTDSKESEMFYFRVYFDSGIRISVPKNNDLIRSDKFPVLLYTEWEEKELSKEYRLILKSQTEEISFQTTRKEYTLSIPKPGLYQLQIQADTVFPELKYSSEWIAFEVQTKMENVPKETKKQEEILPKSQPQKIAQSKLEQPKSTESNNPANVEKKPELKLLTPKGVIDMSKLNSLNFKWNLTGGTGVYILKLYNLDAGRSLVFEEKLTSNTFQLKELSKLDEAKFEWTIEAQLEGKEPVNAKANFSIILSEELEKPNLD
jgi:hypothetical protein